MTRSERENCEKIKNNFQYIIELMTQEQKRVNRLSSRFNWLKDEVKCLNQPMEDLLIMAQEVDQEMENDEYADGEF